MTNKTQSKMDYVELEAILSEALGIEIPERDCKKELLDLINDIKGYKSSYRDICNDLLNQIERFRWS